MNREEPNPASGKEQAEGSRDKLNVSPDCTPSEKCSDDEFTRDSELSGKTDSGPEPDVFGREIPPQD